MFLLAGRQTVSHVGDTAIGPAVTDEPGLFSGPGMWRGTQAAVGSGGTANAAALEEKVEVRVGPGRSLRRVPLACCVWVLAPESNSDVSHMPSVV